MAVPAAAQERPVKLESDVHLLRPANEGGEAQLVEPQGVVPGDTLVFTTRYRNEGSKPVTNFVIVNPVSAELVAVALGLQPARWPLRRFVSRRLDHQGPVVPATIPASCAELYAYLCSHSLNTPVLSLS